MKIIDTNIVNDIMDNDMELSDDQIIYVPEDIRLEIVLSSLLKGKNIPKNIKDLTSLSSFDESVYYTHYTYFLNHIGGNSFYNMKGFGDVSILTAIKTLLDSPDFIESQKLPIPGINESIKIFTRDDGLIKRIKDNFSDEIDKKIFILGLKDLML